MVRKLLIVAILAFTCSILNAQNRFVYLRYDESTSNVSAIIQKIKRMVDTSDDVILFYNHHSYKGDQLSQLIEGRDFLTNISVYEPYLETQELCREIEKLLGEQVDTTNAMNIRLSGEKDTQWELYFILSQTSGRRELIRWLDINGFMGRNIKITFITYDRYTNMNTLSLSQFIEGAGEIMIMNF